MNIDVLWVFREYGPLYKIRIGQRVIIIVSDPDIVQQQLRDRPHRLTRQPATIPVFKELKMHGLFSNEGRSRCNILRESTMIHLPDTLTDIPSQPKARNGSSLASGLRPYFHRAR